MSNIELYITGRERDLGDGFFVRRVLPYATHRMVGPFVFFDHMGPSEIPPLKGFDVRPHPHIGLATVTYLFEGRGWHRDSLGSNQEIMPGDINWMTSGRGIVHSERAPDEFRRKGGREHGIQCWVALPNEFEDVDASFEHYASTALPEFEVSGARVKLLIGEALGHRSPVRTFSRLFYLEVKLPKGASFDFPAEGLEAAFYVVSGRAHSEGKDVEPFVMAVAKTGKDLKVTALEDAHLMILGGEPVGKRYLYWNFVASSPERLEQAKREWDGGPTAHGRFRLIPGDQADFIPLPLEPNPKGTSM